MSSLNAFQSASITDATEADEKLYYFPNSDLIMKEPIFLSRPFLVNGIPVSLAILCLA